MGLKQTLCLYFIGGLSLMIFSEEIIMKDIVLNTISYSTEYDGVIPYVEEEMLDYIGGIDSIIKISEDKKLLSNNNDIYLINDDTVELIHRFGTIGNTLFFSIDTSIYALTSNFVPDQSPEVEKCWNYSISLYNEKKIEVLRSTIPLDEIYGRLDSDYLDLRLNGQITVLNDGSVALLTNNTSITYFYPSTLDFQTPQKNNLVNQKYFIYYIDKYGSQFVKTITPQKSPSEYLVLDKSGNIINDLIIPENGLPTTKLLGDSDLYLYSIDQGSPIESKEEEYKHGYTIYYPLIFSFYKIRRSQNYWEIEFIGDSVIDEIKVTMADSIIVDWPLDNYFDTQISPQYTSWLDFKGNLYYYALSNGIGGSKLEVKMIFFNIDTKIIDWARDGITSSQYANFNNHEISSFLNQATPEEKRIFRNTFFALQGCNFNSRDLKDYFSRFNWYKPNSDNIPNTENLSDSQKLLLKKIIESEKIN